MLNIQENCLIFIVIYHFYLKERQSKSVTSLVLPYWIKKLCCIYKSFKTGIKSWINSKKIAQFIQKAWLKPYIDMNTKLGKKAKNYVEKDLFKPMNNAVYKKAMENVKKHRDIKLVTTDKRRNQLPSEPNYHAVKYFSEIFMAIEMKKQK